MVLILVRHGKSLWNKENRFTGFEDIDICEEGINEAIHCGNLIKQKNINIDYCFTSDLIRTINTANIIKEQLNNNYNIIQSKHLRERDYGDLTGLNKDEVKEKYGEKQVHKWRRSYYDKPPNGENLDDVVYRVGQYFNQNIFPLLDQNKNILIVAHGNSLRALMVHLKEKTIYNIEAFEFKTCDPYFFYNHFYHFNAMQILDSRGFPTIQVKCFKNNKLLGCGSSPSGASCGTNEALELRDNNNNYYNGKSVFRNINYINNTLNYKFKITNNKITNLIELDTQLIELDKSPQKNNIGGNTTTALSFCLAQCGANYLNLELFEYFNYIYNQNSNIYNLPTPMVNILNGGKHAGGKLKIQEFMIMPSQNLDTLKQIQAVCEIYYKLQKLLVIKYGVQSKNVGDEGGFTPNLSKPEEAIDVIIQAIIEANYIPNQDIFIALDCAASEFYNNDDKYYEVIEGQYYNSNQLIDYYVNLIKKYPIIKSIEDPFDECDYEAWIKFNSLMKDNIMIVGDDLFTTNPNLVEKGIMDEWANALLLKVNQIGTITEAVHSAQLMFNQDNNVIVSHRSGETNHSYLVDLAVGIGAQYVKIGAPARGERIEKFNRLLEIYNLIHFN